MKKIFTLIAIAASALTMSASVPELLFQGNPVQAGKTYQTGYTVDEMDFGGGLIMYNYTQDSDLTLRGTNGAGVVVDVEATANIQFCGIDGTCVKGTTFHKVGFLGAHEGSIIATDGDQITVSLQIDNIKNDMSGKPAGEILSDITVNVTAYYSSTPSEKATATVVLTNKPASEIDGISAVEASDYVRLTSRRTLSYNVGAPTKLNVYGVTGSLMMSQTIYNLGTVSLENLPAGVYIYRAGKHTGKILVK